MSFLIATTLLCAANAVPPAPEANPFVPDIAVADAPEPSPLEASYTEPTDEDAKDKPLHKWSGTASFGGTVWNGNTNRKSATALADAEYRREDDRFTLKFFWSYAQETTGITDRQTFGSFKYDYFLSKKSYLFAGVEARNSLTAELQLQTAVGGGYGYQWLEDEKWKLSTEIGVAWYREEYYTADPTRDYVAARGAYKAEYKPTDKWLFANGGEIYQSLDNESDTSSKMLTRARYNFTEKMFVEGIWAWNWDNTPATGADRSDNIYTVNLGFAF
jgi:putative salt-induced outer membrane protein YdiY